MNKPTRGWRLCKPDETGKHRAFKTYYTEESANWGQFWYGVFHPFTTTSIRYW